MRIAVVGAGSIGGFIAAALARSGVETAVVARGAHLEAIRSNGLHVRSDLGEFTVHLPAGENLGDLGSFDYVLLTFKAHQWPELLNQLAPYAKEGATFVTLQNGLPFWFERRPPLQSVDPDGQIGSRISDAQIIGGVVHASGNIPVPGTIEQSGGMRYPMGNPNGGYDARVRALHDVMRSAGLQAELDENIRSTVWLKLINNCGLNPVSALAHATVHEMLEKPELRRRVENLMREAVNVGEALGVVHAVDIQVRLDYAARLADVKTSMLQDLEAHRALELDPIVGAVVELAGRLKVPVPHLRSAYDELHAVC